MHLAAACAEEPTPMLSKSPRHRALADAKIDALVMTCSPVHLRRARTAATRLPPAGMRRKAPASRPACLPRLVYVRYFRQSACISDKRMLDAALTVFKRVETRARNVCDGR